MQLEEGYRADLGAVHDVDDKSHEVIVHFPYEVLDGYRTDWGDRCFDESFARRLPVMVVNHNPDHLIGSAKSAQSIGNRAEVVGRFADFNEVPRARETFSLVKDGHFPGWSFHYRNGRTIPHPATRGARRFVKADMIEFSPVVIPSIPGAQAVGIRSEESALEIPSLETIMKLKADGFTDDEGVRALITEHYPHLVEHIRLVTPPAPAEPDPLVGVRSALTEAGVRDLVIRVDSEGNVSTGDATPDDGADDPATLAQAVDASLDEAIRLVGAVDLTSLAPEVQQAVALVQAASVAVDELLEVMGVTDADEAPDDGERSADADTTAIPDATAVLGGARGVGDAPSGDEGSRSGDEVDEVPDRAALEADANRVLERLGRRRTA